MAVPDPREPSALERLGEQITVALSSLRSARKSANTEQSGYRANQELMAQVQLDQLLERWPTRRPVL